MLVSFPYRKEKFKNTFIFRPKIPITIKYGDNSINIVALVDSGSDVTLIPREIAEVLGIELRGEKQEISLIDGKANVYSSTVRMIVKSKDRTVPINMVDVEIADERMKDVDEIILGRSGFFDKFDITFRENKKRIELQESKR